MKSIEKYFASMGIDLSNMAILLGVLVLATLLLGAIARFIFGKRSTLSAAVSSAIGILFIYTLAVVLNSAGVGYEKYVAPLPFTILLQDTMCIYAPTGHYAIVCSELLSMVILSFLVNLADRWIPKGKHALTWIASRTLVVIIGYAMHLLVVYLFATYLPEGIVTYAPTIMLGLLVLFLVTGIMKWVIGTLLSATVNPFIGAMYTFFFANVIGKMVTRAMLTTAILYGLVYLLNNMGIMAIAIGSAALVAYIPFLLILAALWYIINKIF